MSNKVSSLISIQTSGLSSIASLIALSNFVPHTTRLISNQQTLFSGRSEIIARIFERPKGEWTEHSIAGSGCEQAFKAGRCPDLQQGCSERHSGYY